MLPDSMAVACPPPIWVTVCIPNHSLHVEAPRSAKLHDQRMIVLMHGSRYLEQRLQYRSPSQVWQRRVASWLQMQHHGSSSSSLSDG